MSATANDPTEAEKEMQMLRCPVDRLVADKIATTAITGVLMMIVGALAWHTHNPSLPIVFGAGLITSALLFPWFVWFSHFPWRVRLEGREP